ncbi:NAD(P)/FAD-dependent oxidoreductase [Bacillus sp. FJAT-49705]|uniref:NAD(P)/FAD-dependent oxidoreductase n=1 Tax=Cytobacillus citreus TaxID=2833586 RepID=A0ABS5NR60_9BACI|nr:FAD/NAD(P)-binding oxidoreductase [Cytobacillus citreus]MBS4190303.1 NAD(P)/FAD-dependent oxidoreductase [Cytobacillus citreus]
MSQTKYAEIVIVGAGSAGISIASRIIRNAPYLKENIMIIDPSEDHYYQPLWTLVGGGQSKLEDTHRKQDTLIPDGVQWLKEAATEFLPDTNTVVTDKNTQIHYDFLVVTAGIEIKWDRINGLKEAIGKNGVCSNYAAEYVESTWENIKNFSGGTAIFTQPSTPIKCGGAPQKIMYLADDYFNKANVRSKTNIKFISGTGSIFSVPRYAKTLEEVINRKEIETTFMTDLIEIDGKNKTAIFQHIETNEKMSVAYDMIHVTPPMGAPSFIASSPIANATGWVDVDPHTLQHNTYKNIFSAGDSASLPTSKTGAAIRKQAPVAAENLLSVMNGSTMKAKYNGYTSCPLVTGVNKLVMAEFEYDNVPQETFPIDQSKERMSMYLIKKNLLPIMYWNGMLKGTM